MTERFVDYINELDLHLQYHDTLNPTLWDGETIRPEVRAKLLRFAQTWAEFAHIPRTAIRDIQLTGGNANHNYTPQSDLDVHLIVDKTTFGHNGPPTFDVDSYLRSRKQLWSLTNHPTIYGYSIEPYAQDITEHPPAGQGVYSLRHNRWIVRPTNLKFDFGADKTLEKKVQKYMDVIDQMIADSASIRRFVNLKDRIVEMRRAGINKDGEFSADNLIFKSLRNSGYLQKISAHLQSMKDKELSL